MPAHKFPGGGGGGGGFGGDLLSLDRATTLAHNTNVTWNWSGATALENNGTAFDYDPGAAAGSQVHLTRPGVIAVTSQFRINGGTVPGRVRLVFFDNDSPYGFTDEGDGAPSGQVTVMTQTEIFFVESTPLNPLNWEVFQTSGTTVAVRLSVELVFLYDFTLL